MLSYLDLVPAGDEVDVLFRDVDVLFAVASAYGT